MPPELHLDPSTLDCNHVVADREAIQRINLQRYEMEQLDAVIFLDTSRLLIAGFKDVRHDEFWIRGHMPGYPLMPGVLICEAAAQLCSYYTVSQKLMEADFIGFGGIEDVRFRGLVRPGDRLVLIGKGVRIHRRQTIMNVQAFVGSTMVFHGDIIGVPLMRKEGG